MSCKKTAMGSLFLMLSAAALHLLACEAHSDLRLTVENGQNLRVPDGWTEERKLDKDETLPLLFAVKQSNLEKLENLFWDVSTPKTKRYRQFLSHEELNRIISPRDDSIDAISSWLSESGLDVAAACRWTKGKEFLSCTLPSFVAESLLGVSFSLYSHSSSGLTATRACEHYTVPIGVAPHLDFVGGVHRFPHTPRPRQQRNVNAPLVGLQTPSSLRTRYNVGSTVAGKSSANIQAVAQFLGQYYGKTDLTEFFKLFGSGFTHRPDVDRVIGPNKFRSGPEANLDVQYIMSLGANATTWFWSTSGKPAGHEPFLQWMMDVANASSIPQVMSVSYGDEESTFDVTYMQRVNAEFMKQGLRGMSVLVASGDAGAYCRSNVLNPIFPSSSPYITAVGGTEGFLASGTEKAAALSSGGFSNVFTQPPYQTAAVEHYLSASSHLPKAAYNRSGRAFPDVAAMAMNYVSVDTLIPQPIDGTSCSAPTFSGIMSLVTDGLLAGGKAPLGFLNPFLYENAEALHDITEQCSGGCDGESSGWCAAAGWDAVTGLGTPNYPELLKAAQSV